MHILQLLLSFLFGSHIEVVVTPLPELRFTCALQFSRCPLLQNFNCCRQQRNTRLTDEQMDVLRHQDVAGDHKSISPAHRLKLTF
jgi:hypothetical protein